MRSPLMETEPNPSPMPEMDQISEGPDGGHSFSKPVSVEILVRSGPCHCGQSLSAAMPAARKSPAITMIYFDRRISLLPSFPPYYMHNCYFRTTNMDSRESKFKVKYVYISFELIPYAFQQFFEPGSFLMAQGVPGSRMTTPG